MNTLYLRVFFCLLILLPASALGQECVPSASPLWMSPEKGTQDVPLDAALMLSIPLGVDISVVMGDELSPVSGSGYGQFIFPLEGHLQVGNNSGYVEAGLGGSTSKKSPFQLGGTDGLADRDPVAPTPAFIEAGTIGADAPTTFCDEVLQGLFCANEPLQGVITVTMGSTAHAWAVSDSETQEWVLIPGECSPSILVSEANPTSRCVNVIALSESGTASEPALVCVGDTFDNGEAGLTDSDQEDTSASGCKTGESPALIPLLILLGIAGGARRRLTGRANA